MNRNELLNTIYGSRLWKNIKSDFVIEAKRVRTMSQQAEFLNKWSFYLFFESPIGTIKGRILDMKKELNKNGIKEDNPILDYFKIQTEVYTILNNNQQNKVYKKLMNEDESKINFSKLSKTIIDELVSEIDNNDIATISNNSRKSRELAYQKLIVLAVATGRRQIELLKMLEISKKRENALYKNLAKKKESDDDSIVAPILLDVSIAKKYLKDIKEEFQTQELTNKQVNSKYNASVSKSLFRYLDESIANNGFHYLRAVYAKACFEKFGNGKDENLYIQEILGHEIKLNAGHNYQAKAK